LKKPNREKNPIKIKKNQPVQFWFYKYEIEKTEPNPNKKKNRAKLEKNQAKPSQIEKTKPNQFEPIYVLKKQTESKPVDLNRF
jgi:hypothetical protein